MVKIIKAFKFPDRKDSFRDMVDKLCSQRMFKEKNKLDLWLKDTACSSNRFANDPDRWKKFQNKYKEEFEKKIRLIDEIWEKKKENLAVTWI
jgi:uncharacterized protein YeaO (DUF488 family)